MESINDAVKLIAQAIKELNEFDNSYEIALLEKALEKLTKCSI